MICNRINHIAIYNQTFVVRASCPQNVYLIPSQTAVSITFRVRQSFMGETPKTALTHQ